MSFTVPHAFELLSTAFSDNRLPHALLIVGDDEEKSSTLILKLLRLINGIRATSLDHVMNPHCCIIKPKSKSRRILKEDVQAVEKILQQKAESGFWKIVVFLSAERMNEEAANAFLKTLEEPPSQSLIILCTSQPDQLLRTILSRCVRMNLLASGEFQLTELQKNLMPYWIEACNHINQDLAALIFRTKFQEVMKAMRDEIGKNLERSLKSEAKEIAQGTGVTNWESLNKEANAAQLETEYLVQRRQALDLMISWFGQAAKIASGAPDFTPIHPEVRKLAQALPLTELLRRMDALNQLCDDLNFNVHEEQALDVYFLEALGESV